ncbi:hypothetical protein ALX04_006635 [Lactiplantibacillus plantarum subsp. plantarum]|uniref:hypothetical protein n=1 Tax=Lactiplantibacillus plantarum TaxID=1590 RepID=UPI0006A6A71B|nr:hypothetical protein [Lactiplantibacillus plantarum]ASI63358.1 hypothetical protein ALX04_006635 [Lactiplantibacillus plantarum subsp. plantarum]KAE9508235.1 hypothetical protein FET70_01696 [Lactiplantibacillus plantarum]KZT79816.1 hypothetical protein Nizo1838_1606 [Lactiplantibacillus plantarum]KZT91692.1 hypothetical protein Nizo2256_0286 [Lactiplantibacillus plantarum]MCG0628397.1 hypothetical protein [Lactiplantibacillus plantarum]
MEDFYNHEIKTYIQFCSTFFSESFILNHFQRRKILRLFQMIAVFDVISDYDATASPALRSQARKAKESVLKLLYAIPTCEDLFISTCFRQLSEEIIKIVYVQLVDSSVNVTEISKSSYRNLWEFGIKTTSDYKMNIDFKVSIDKINNIFKHKSDDLHSKYTDTKNLTVYLQQIICEGSDFSEKELYSSIDILSIFSIDWLPRVCKLNINLMTMPQRHQFLKMVKSLA